MAGPMTFRISTLKIATSGPPGVTTNACSRNRNASTKISSPRQTTASAAAARLPALGRSFAGERQCQAGQPQEQRGREPAENREIPEGNPGAIASPRPASSTCARIMISTAIPRTRSMYGRRPSETDVKRHLEEDVLPQRLPHRAVLLAREPNGPLNSVARNVSLDVEVKRDAQEPVGSSGARWPPAVLQGAEDVAAFGEDVREICRHAAAQRRAERLHGRRSGDPRAVEHEHCSSGACRELEAPVPGKVDDRGRLRHDRPILRRFRPLPTFAASDHGRLETGS